MNSRPLALLVDLDGVLRHWPIDDHEIEQNFRLPPGIIRAVAFSAEFLYPALTGKVSDSEWRAQIVAELKSRAPTAAVEGAVLAWSSHLGRIDATVLRHLSHVRSDLRVILVTNATTRLADDLNRLQVATLFHAVINSSSIGAFKPDPAIFQSALASAGCAPHNALFVDDSPGNVVAAQALGITSHHFRSAEGLHQFLIEFGAYEGTNS